MREAVANWKSIIEDPIIDAVCIGTWPYMHCPITIAALENNKHVLCEARMALNAREAHKMLDTSRKNPHLVAQIVPAPHTLAIDQTINELIGSDFIGDLISMHGRINSGANFPAPNSTPHWRHDKNLSGNNEGSLISCIDETKTASGARLLRQRIIEPFYDLNLIQDRYDVINWILGNNIDITLLLNNKIGHVPDSNNQIKSAFITYRLNNQKWKPYILLDSRRRKE